MRRKTHNHRRYLTEKEVAALQRAASGIRDGKRGQEIDFHVPNGSVDLDDMRRQRDAFMEDARYWMRVKFNGGAEDFSHNELYEVGMKDEWS